MEIINYYCTNCKRTCKATRNVLPFCSRCSYPLTPIEGQALNPLELQRIELERKILIGVFSALIFTSLMVGIYLLINVVL